ncbi:hypothetical protein [Nostoc sp. UIC 10607]|uniref:hypothetical protein n=1 Tax=Nostoc sp. UIC 10607 TaxID=3045935 RepID=UPI0039A2FA3D
MQRDLWTTVLVGTSSVHLMRFRQLTTASAAIRQYYMTIAMTSCSGFYSTLRRTARIRFV